MKEEKNQNDDNQHDGKFPGLACLICGAMTWAILKVLQLLSPGYIPWLVVFLPVLTIVFFLISIIMRREIVLAVIGLLLGGSALVLFFL